MVLGADRPREELLAIRARHDLRLGHGRIDPFAVAHRVGLEVVRYPVPDDAIEGIYRPLEGGGGAILVNSRPSMLRQRFTAAHEIGHYVLHAGELAVDIRIADRDPRMSERQANRFAGALLVDPVVAAEEWASHHGEVGPSIARIVDAFEVSVPTAALVLEQLGLAARSDIEAFLGQYETVGHRAFMEAHGLRSMHRAGSARLVLDRGYRERVTRLLSSGRLSPERAADLLGIEVADLPRAAIRARQRLLDLMDSPSFE